MNANKNLWSPSILPFTSRLSFRRSTNQYPTKQLHKKISKSRKKHIIMNVAPVYSEIYRPGNLGSALMDAIDELVVANKMEPQAATFILRQFDRIMAKGFGGQTKAKMSSKGNLHTYRKLIPVFKRPLWLSPNNIVCTVSETCHFPNPQSYLGQIKSADETSIRPLRQHLDPRAEKHHLQDGRRAKGGGKEDDYRCLQSRPEGSSQEGRVGLVGGLHAFHCQWTRLICRSSSAGPQNQTAAR